MHNAPMPLKLELLQKGCALPHTGRWNVAFLLGYGYKYRHSRLQELPIACCPERRSTYGKYTKEKGFMLTIEGLIAVISLSATMFALGYAVGNRK